VKMNQRVIIAIWLRDAYIRISDRKDLSFLSALHGFPERSFRSEEKAYNSVMHNLDNQDFFVRGDNMSEELNRVISSTHCNAYITLTITGLRDVYYSNRHSLSPATLEKLNERMDQSLPTFMNVFDYDSLQDQREKSDIPLYQLFGKITEFDVVHIPIVEFIDAINQERNIIVHLPENQNIELQLAYEKYDLYDISQQRLIHYINPGLCLA